MKGEWKRETQANKKHWRSDLTDPCKIFFNTVWLSLINSLNFPCLGLWSLVVPTLLLRCIVRARALKPIPKMQFFHRTRQTLCGSNHSLKCKSTFYHNYSYVRGKKISMLQTILSYHTALPVPQAQVFIIYIAPWTQKKSVCYP